MSSPYQDWDSVREEFQRFRREVEEDIASMRSSQCPQPPRPTDITVHSIIAPTWAQRRKWFFVFWRIAWSVLLSGRASLKLKTTAST